MKLNFALRLQHVPRWGVMRTIRQQTVAEHCFNVACIYVWFCEQTNRKVRGRDLVRVLAHDMEEAYEGDIPGPVKHEMTKYDHEPDTLDLVIKLCDRLEELAYMVEEERMGNRTMKFAFHTAMGRGQKHFDRLESRDGAETLAWNDFQELWWDFRDDVQFDHDPIRTAMESFGIGETDAES